MRVFLVQSFQCGSKGIPFADPPQEAPTEAQAVRLAARLATSKLGVVVLARESGADDAAEVRVTLVARLGDLPEHYDVMAIAI